MALGLLLITAGACAQTNPTGEVGTFAEATKAYAVEASEAYQAINRITLERRIADLATETDANKLGRRLVDQKALQATDVLDKFLAGAPLQARLALLGALTSYASALSELSTANYKKSIDAAGQELGGTLKSLSSTLATTTDGGTPLSDAEAGAITAVVSAFGNAIVEEKRQSAIKEVVIKFNPIIQNTTQTLSSGDWDALGDLQLANYDTLYTEDVKAYQKEFSKLSNAQRRERLHQISESYASIRGAPAFFENLKQASVKVGNAHQALSEAVSNNEFTSEELVREISELAALVGSLSSFRHRFEAQS